MNAHNGNTFGAPWGASVKAITGLTALWAIAMVVIGIALPGAAPLYARIVLVLVPLIILGGTALFMVRGYRIRDGEVEIERLGWSTSVDLGSLKSATADPDATSWKSLRLCGNGGLFAFVGWFWNRKLGKYRAFATDPKRSVVLRFPDRTVVVTPDEPERFIEEIRRRTDR